MKRINSLCHPTMTRRTQRYYLYTLVSPRESLQMCGVKVILKDSLQIWIYVLPKYWNDYVVLGQPTKQLVFKMFTRSVESREILQ